MLYLKPWTDQSYKKLKFGSCVNNKVYFIQNSRWFFLSTDNKKKSRYPSTNTWKHSHLQEFTPVQTIQCAPKKKPESITNASMSHYFHSIYSRCHSLIACLWCTVTDRCDSQWQPRGFIHWNLLGWHQGGGMAGQGSMKRCLNRVNHGN